MSWNTSTKVCRPARCNRRAALFTLCCKAAMTGWRKCSMLPRRSAVAAGRSADRRDQEFQSSSRVSATAPVVRCPPRRNPSTPAPHAEAGADMVKVSAELLDDLVNLAGETSIFRGRIEQQVNDAQIALSEMETTIERMRDQLRRLDTETQGRILSRQQVEAERLGYEEFDPLEMDRHSQLQQLSRALFESASDLLDLKETLDRRNQDAENLLQQQGRINTELQEGLMRTRMVPFERMLPRLKRIVRQVSSELGKDVEFVVGNAEGEMDRNVLERMAAPLEHMLRNAVDHGLESAEVRMAAGKPAKGRITLDLSREGGDIVFDIRDDGAGVPLDAVRRKAIKRGLLAPDADISDRDVLQFILQPGFSTAEKITQISGRGVGMDVVHDEVRQLGGTMVIDSIPGQGVHFRIRLPFTVSVNRALMVQCGEDQYAIPLNTIDGIVRVLPNELEGHYRLDPPRYQYGGQHYELCYLGELLKTSTRPKLLGQTLPLPVLLVHCNERHIAVQVDSMAGTREIVVKSLGPQFAAVQGLVRGDDSGRWPGGADSRFARADPRHAGACAATAGDAGRRGRAAQTAAGDGGRRLGHRAQGHQPLAGTPRHERADGQGRCRRHAAARRTHARPDAAGHRNAAHGRLRSRDPSAQRRTLAALADHHDHFPHRPETPRPCDGHRRQRLPRQAVSGIGAARQHRPVEQNPCLSIAPAI